MIHLPPLPGTPFHIPGTLDQIIDTAVRSATLLYENDVDGCLIQTADRVYGIDEACDPARVAAVAMIASGVIRATAPQFRVGVQIMRNALQASLAVAKVAGGSFIRVGALVGTTASPQGMVTPDPLALMTYRNVLHAENLQIIADIHSMHYRWHGEPRTIGDLAELAVNAGADGVCLGDPDDDKTLALMDAVRSRTPSTPIFLAGYTNCTNVVRMLAGADGVFVGSAFERGGWGGIVDRDLVCRYVNIARSV